MSSTVFATPHCNPYPSSVRDYVELLKPGVMTLVVFSAAVGMWLAPGQLHPFLQAVTVLCVAMGSGAGAALNMWFDRDIDAIMKRTQNRPIPARRIHPDDALAFGIFLGVASVSLLGLAVGWLAAGILAFAIFFYSVIYTVWLKRSTPQNIVIGGAAGAFPPVIGWAAVTGDVSAYSLVLFAIIFLWTPPHFWALALFRNEDYKRAKVPMLPVTAGLETTTRHMLFYTLVLVAVTLLPLAYGWQGAIYAVSALILGVGFLQHAVKVWRQPEDRFSKPMFGYSILYLFALFASMLIDRLYYLPLN